MWYHVPAEHDDESNDEHVPPFELNGLSVGQDGALSYGGYVWPAALALTAYLEDILSPGQLQNPRVLEIGAGCGLPGLAAAQLGATVTLTDMDDMIPHLKRNALSNSQAAPVHEVKALELGTDVRPEFTRGSFDFIVAADVTYIVVNRQALAISLLLLVDRHTVVVISHSKRMYDGVDNLLTIFGAFFDMEEIDVAGLKAFERWSGADKVSLLDAFVWDDYAVRPEGHPLLFRVTLKEELVDNIEAVAEEQLQAWNALGSTDDFSK